MKYVSEKYERQLDELAELLVTQRRFGDAALQDTVEFEPISIDVLTDLEEPSNG